MYRKYLLHYLEGAEYHGPDMRLDTDGPENPEIQKVIGKGGSVQRRDNPSYINMYMVHTLWLFIGTLRTGTSSELFFEPL